MKLTRRVVIVVLLFSLLIPTPSSFASFYIETSSSVRNVGNAIDGNTSSFAIFDGLVTNTMVIGGLQEFPSLHLRIAPASHSSIPILAEYLDSSGGVISQGNFNARIADANVNLSLPEGTASVRLTKSSAYYQVNLYEINYASSITAPTDFSASLLGREVTLTWNPVANAVGYSLYRDDVRVNQSLIVGNSFVDTLSSSGTFSYFVRAVDSSRFESGRSNTSSVSVVVPLAPSNLVATLDNNIVSLSWTPSGTAEVLGYNIYRNGIRVNGSLLETTNFSDTLNVSGTYDYRVTSVHSSLSESDFSPTDSVFYFIPAPHSDLRLDLVVGRNTINSGSVTVTSPSVKTSVPVQSILPYGYHIVKTQ